MPADADQCSCPVCTGHTCAFALDKQRPYHRCQVCTAIFVPPAWHLTAAAAKQRYCLHDNTLQNRDYVRYLSCVADQVQCYAPVASPLVLDFGSGPECVLQAILQQRGIACASFDPVFGHHWPQIKRFDLIVMCEVIEHLAALDAEMQRILPALAPTGRLLIRTRLFNDALNFDSWWYKNDPTHILFFSQPSMAALARRYALQVVHSDAETTVLQTTDSCLLSAGP